MLITFTGAQSTGKSTLVKELKKNPFLTQQFTFIDSFTRKLQQQHGATVDKGNDEMQKAMIEAHVSCAKLDNAILDRCLLDCTAYSYYFAERGDISQSIADESFQAMLKYRNNYDIVFYLRPEFGVISDGVRPESLEYQQAMSRIFDRLILHMPNVITLSGNVENRLNTIYKALRSKGIEC